jgi:hypothetical protein
VGERSVGWALALLGFHGDRPAGAERRQGPQTPEPRLTAPSGASHASQSLYQGSAGLPYPRSRSFCPTLPIAVSQSDRDDGMELLQVQG